MPKRHPSGGRLAAIVALALGSGACQDPNLNEAPPPPEDSPAPPSDGEPAPEIPCEPGPVDPDALPRRGWVRVCPGAFVMGSPLEERDRRVSETPHPVTITRPFLLVLDPRLSLIQLPRCREKRIEARPPDNALLGFGGPSG